jgi:single-stranded-DNA-specific exonuclease
MVDKRLDEALKYCCEKINGIIENSNEFLVITHLDADGIAAGSIIATALSRLGSRCTVRTVSDLSLEVIDDIKSDNRDFNIITDLGGGMTNELHRYLNNKWIVIDHHQITKEEITADHDNQILNPWKFDIDGGKEISAGGMAYLVAATLDRKNKDLSTISIISALADRQDQGDKKSLIGINSEIVKTAQSLGLVEVELDILFTGREIKPLHEALAYTSFPYIDKLTWNKENCYTLVKNTGIKMKSNDKWRVISDLSPEEKSIVLDAIAKFVATTSQNSSTNLIDNLLGYAYILRLEDQRSHLRDAREFSTLLNACGRTGKAGVGIGICIGDRYRTMSEGEAILNDYRETLRHCISSIFDERWRFIDDGNSIFVNGEGLLADNMLGSVSTLLSGSPSLGGRLLFVRSLTKDNSYKFSSRKCLECGSKANLGKIMRNCSESVGGSGGGHSSAAGCKIPSLKLEVFLSSIRNAVHDSQYADQY